MGKNVKLVNGTIVIFSLSSAIVSGCILFESVTEKKTSVALCLLSSIFLRRPSFLTLDLKST